MLDVRDGLRAVVVPSVSIVDRHAWDALVADSDFYHCHGWLVGLDHALGPADVLTLHGPTGLCGGCALWDGERDPGLFCLEEYFHDIPGPWDRDFLWVGARRSTRNELPCTHGPGRRRTLRALLDAAADLAARRGRAGVVVPYMPLDKALELAAVHEGARAILHAADASLDVPVGGMAAMMDRLDAHGRWRTNRELSTFAERGGRVEWRSFDAGLERVAADLIAQNRAKHGSLQGQAWMRRMLDGQRRSGVLDAAMAAVACRGDRVIALTVFYRFGKLWHTRYFGSDYAVANDDFRYFVLSYYACLDQAAAQGVGTIELSISSLKAKSLRGATVNPLAAVVLTTAAGPPARDAVARHNGSFAAEHRARFRQRLSPAWNLIPV